jgi:hypothetical protein
MDPLNECSHTDTPLAMILYLDLAQRKTGLSIGACLIVFVPVRFPHVTLLVDVTMSWITSTGDAMNHEANMEWMFIIFLRAQTKNSGRSSWVMINDQPAIRRQSCI